MKSLKEYLRSKPIYYEEIDYSFMPKLFGRISHHFNLPRTIHIVGTNGKGSTGRYLGQILEEKGFSVGHYTSPHILTFNERFYKNGEFISDECLESLHQRLYEIVKEEEERLSYFEYTTLLAFLAFEDCDYLILEAGLGGEFDATNVVPKILSIVTPISYDHLDFLGKSIKEIALTKIRSVRNSAVIAPQKSEEVYELLRVYEKENSLDFICVDKDNISLQVEEQIEKYANKYNLPQFLKENLYTAYIAAQELGVDVDLQNMKRLNLRGRCEKIAPNITTDVGHNEAAAKELLEVFSGKKIVLVYNAYKDKDFKKVLEILMPIISTVELIDIDNSYRKNAKEEIAKFLDANDIVYKTFDGVDDKKEYLVFGSFGVIESFLKESFEK